MPTTTRRAAALAPDDRRAMLVATTLELVLESGADVSTRQIAEAAGVAEGTIFRVFDTKEELLRGRVGERLRSLRPDRGAGVRRRAAPLWRTGSCTPSRRCRRTSAG